MSHVAKIEMEIKNLDCLERAAKACGLEFHRNQHTYRWFGEHVGDYPMPEGFTEKDLGKCDHALSVPNNDEAYEIGVVKRGDSYTLLWDFWAGGNGLEEKVGENAEKLCNNYLLEEAKQAFAEEYEGQGFNFSFQQKQNGDIYVEMEN